VRLREGQLIQPAAEGIMQQEDCDVCVVGAGPAGLTVARTLSKRGLKVTVVESGDWDVSVNAQDLKAGGAVGYPYHSLDKALFSGVGGSALLWSGNNRFRPLDAIDFEKRPVYLTAVGPSIWITCGPST
jgi:glycine/D-amino acid oxidase-like deaminating enzyme